MFFNASGFLEDPCLRSGVAYFAGGSSNTNPRCKQFLLFVKPPLAQTDFATVGKFVPSEYSGAGVRPDFTMNCSTVRVNVWIRDPCPYSPVPV